MSPFYSSPMEYQCLILNPIYPWWAESGGKERFKMKEKKNPFLCCQEERILSLSRANVGCDPLISPLDKFSLQAKPFSFESAVMQTYSKITQKECFATE